VCLVYGQLVSIVSCTLEIDVDAVIGLAFEGVQACIYPFIFPLKVASSGKVVRVTLFLTHVALFHHIVLCARFTLDATL
jgi:hypothetical protein